MAESLLLPVVRGVVGKAADVLVQKVARMWGVDGDRRKLERHLLYVQSLLADAEMKSETNPAMKAWMRELKAAAYQADDVLDDFQYEALRREAQSGDSKASKGMDSLTALCKNIDMEATGFNSSRAIFPKLKTMRLVALPEMKAWAENSTGEPNNLVFFPQLEELRIHYCNKIATLPETPALTSLSCYGRFVEGVVPMSIPLGSSPSLVRLDIEMRVDMVMPVNDHQNQSQRCPLDSLRRLRVRYDNGFISVFNSSKLQLGLGDCLAFLELLEISACSNIVRWPVEEFRCLGRLRSLDISWCWKLEGKGSSSEEILPLPQLERLKILGCDCLMEIPKLPVSVGEMEISWCKSLVALPSNLGDLPKLRNLRLLGCPELKTLADGMDGVTSLEWLSISSCGGIHKFPQGLLQRLPDLRFLRINYCPDLQRRCREDGEYFDFVSPIPEKDITVETEPSIKKSTKRFLPLCGGGDSQSN